jgi:hypothetical protein
MYGTIGHPVMIFEAYKAERDRRLALRESGFYDTPDVQAGLASGEINEADTRADFPSFLFGPVRQSLWHSYQRIAPQFRRYMRMENMPDFRERRLRGLNALTGYGWVGEHGNYVPMRRSERPAAALVIDIYGGRYDITFPAVVNDDTGELLNSVPGEMGQAAAEFKARAAIALITSNPTAPDGNPFFSSGRGNQITAALSEDSLADGITALETQVDDSGFLITIRAALLAVQNARMELIAKRILNSTITGTQQTYAGAAGVGSNVFDKGTDNPLAGILPADGVVRDPYWPDANDWYLFADPGTVPGFAIGTLNGNDQPQVFIRDTEMRNANGAGFDPYTQEWDVVSFKVRDVFGLAPVDPRGALRAAVP